MSKNNLTGMSIRMKSDLHRLLKTLAGYERRPMNSLIVNLIYEALQHRKHSLKLPEWVVSDEFSDALREE
jgi:hypothetical protein